MCRIRADCTVAAALTVVPEDNKRPEQGRHSNDIAAAPEEVAELRNCNGVLTVGSC